MLAISDIYNTWCAHVHHLQHLVCTCTASTTHSVYMSAISDIYSTWCVGHLSSKNVPEILDRRHITQSGEGGWVLKLPKTYRVADIMSYVSCALDNYCIYEMGNTSYMNCNSNRWIAVLVYVTLSLLLIYWMNTLGFVDSQICSFPVSANTRRP